MLLVLLAQHQRRRVCRRRLLHPLAFSAAPATTFPLVRCRYNPAPASAPAPTLPWGAARRHLILGFLHPITNLITKQLGLDLLHIFNSRLYNIRVKRRTVYRSPQKFLLNGWGHVVNETLCNVTSCYATCSSSRVRAHGGPIPTRCSAGVFSRCVIPVRNMVELSENLRRHISILDSPMLIQGRLFCSATGSCAVRTPLRLALVSRPTSLSSALLVDRAAAVCHRRLIHYWLIHARHDLASRPTSSLPSADRADVLRRMILRSHCGWSASGHPSAFAATKRVLAAFFVCFCRYIVVHAPSFFTDFHPGPTHLI